jgi:hypothetical protein
MVFTHNGVLFIHKEVKNYAVFRKMDRSGDHYINRKKPYSERKVSRFLSHVEFKGIENKKRHESKRRSTRNMEGRRVGRGE